MLNADSYQATEIYHSLELLDQPAYQLDARFEDDKYHNLLPDLFSIQMDARNLLDRPPHSVNVFQAVGTAIINEYYQLLEYMSEIR